MSYKRKNFGILGGEAKGGASIRLYSYLLDKEETFDDLLATGYFNEERERLLPNDLIKVLMPDKDFKLGYLMVKKITLDNVEVIKVEIDAKSDLLPLPDSDNGSSGNGDLISRHDHQHPKVIATEKDRGQIIVASKEETLQGIENTKAITPLKNKLYFNNQQATNEEINNGANVKKYINPLQVKTIKDELQQNINNNTTLINNNTTLINNNTTLINTNKQELDEDISNINQNIVNINSQIQGINTNKANVSLDNINAEGQNVIKGIISSNVTTLVGLKKINEFNIEDGDAEVVITGIGQKETIIDIDGLYANSTPCGLDSLLGNSDSYYNTNYFVSLMSIGNDIPTNWLVNSLGAKNTVNTLTYKKFNEWSITPTYPAKLHLKISKVVGNIIYVNGISRLITTEGKYNINFIINNVLVQNNLNVDRIKIFLNGSTFKAGNVRIYQEL